jgi:hypothetical protein
VSVSWQPGPAPCDRPSCARRALHRDIAAGATIVAAAGVLLGPPDGRVIFGPATILAALAWAVIAARRCRHDSDWISDLMRDLGHPAGRLPRRWTAADWAELEQELSR